MYKYKVKSIEYLEYNEYFAIGVDDKSTIAICECLNKGILDEGYYKFVPYDNAMQTKYWRIGRETLVIYKS